MFWQLKQHGGMCQRNLSLQKFRVPKIVSIILSSVDVDNILV